MWIEDLGEYYAHNKAIPQIRIDLLLDYFATKDADVLEVAARDYMINEEHFPTVARFKPYVKTAEHTQMAKMPRTFGIAEGEDGDDERFRIEVERGSMRPLEEIEAEIDAARIQLEAMRERGTA